MFQFCREHFRIETLYDLNVSSIRLAAVDDDPAALDLLRAYVPGGMAVETYVTGQDCLDGARRNPPDIAILDLRLPDLDGIELLRRLRALLPTIEVILLTAEYSTEAAVAAIKAGASDYLTKPVKLARFREALERSLQAIRRRRELLAFECGLDTRYIFEGMVGRCPATRAIFDLVRRIGPHFRTALVSGASGTGKELAARALHALSGRGNSPFVVCNCGAIPESLVDSELFGRVRGAYTGAVGDSTGYFGRAAGGTLMLDEIGELPLTAQASLLRAVQFGEVQRLGASSPVRVDLRIVACTNRDLREAVRNRTFREDLFFRFATFELTMPSLLQRREDIPLLIRYFLERGRTELHKEISGLSEQAESVLMAYSWPGNVRELEQAIHYGAVMALGERIEAGDLPAYLTAPQLADTRGPSAPGSRSRAEAQNRHVLAVLEQAGGNRQEAAHILGVSRTTLWRLLKRAQATD